MLKLIRSLLKHCVILILVVSVLGTMVSTSATQPSMPTSYVLPAGHYIFQEVHVTTPEIIETNWNSTGNVSVMVMTSNQFSQFLNGSNPFQGAVTLAKSGTESYLALEGVYYIVVYAYIQSVTVNFTYNLAPANVTFTLGPSYYETYTLNLSYPFKLHVLLVSNYSMIVRVYTLQNRTLFLFKGNQTNLGNFVNKTLVLPAGEYNISILNLNQFPLPIYASVTYYSLYPNPFSQSRTYFPMGVASYGLFNRSGVPVPYIIEAPVVLGWANVSAISAFDNQSKVYNVSSHSASLQLNVPLVVNTGSGNQTFWVQNVVEFLTNESSLCYQSSVLNVTSVNATLTNDTISGRGAVYPPFYNGFYYTYTTRNYTYHLPLSLELSVNVSVLKGIGVQVKFWVMVIQNGSQYPQKGFTFDSVLIKVPAKEAFLYVSGYQSPVAINYYDAELVFGGGGNGAVATFRELKAYLAIFYYNGSLKPFPSVYSFGEDTAEAATNVNVVYTGNWVSVTVGQEDPVFLTNDFVSQIPKPFVSNGNVVKNATNTSSQSGVTKVTTTNTTSVTSKSNESTSSPNSTSLVNPSKVQGSGFNQIYLLVPVTAVLLVLILLFFRRRSRRPTLNF